MDIINVTDARANFYSIIDGVAESHEPVIIKGKRNNAVLIAESDWSAITETLHLISIKGMKESIIEGLSTDIEDCAEDLSW
jgi:PHD/YefM family antitoxin component YafN of YafNO toxin-antitoxin module